AIAYVFLRRIKTRTFPSVWIYFITLALACGTAAIGFGPFVAVAVFCTSAAAVGSLILSESFAYQPGEIAICLCLGEGLLGFSASLIGRTYLCYPSTFLILMLVPILLQRRWMASRVAHIRKMVCFDDGSSAGRAAVTVLILVVGIQFLLALKPEVGTDSLAM